MIDISNSHIFILILFLDKKSKLFFYILDENGGCLKIRKDTFIRLFNEPEFLSKDRTKRFISKKKENFEVLCHTKVAVNDKIGISDWIIVKNFSGCAQVLEYKQISGKTIKERRVRESVLEINAAHNKGIGMLLQYYVIKSNGNLSPANVNGINDTQFISLSCYKMHLPPPSIINNVKSYSVDIVQQLSFIIKLSPSKCFSTNFARIISKPSQVKRKIKHQDKGSDDESETDERERVALQNIQNRKRARLF